jgi:tetratricopeptide (TPR) repeat protein
VLLVAGLLEQTASRYEIALEYYRRVQEREPRNTDAWRRVAGVYTLMNIRDKAVQAYRKAIELEPGYYAAYSELGIFYYNHGNYPEAAAEFRNSIERAPGAVMSYMDLGAVMSNLGRFGEAEQALLQSLKIKETPEALNSLGVVRAQQNRDREAAGFYERAIAMLPRNAIYLLNLGDCYRRLGRKADATGAYRRAMDVALGELQQDPRKGSTRAFVAYFAAMLDDPGRAEEEMVQAQQLSPGDARVIRRAVLMYELMGQRQRALAALSGSTPELLQELSLHPDLADFCRDARFQQLTGKAGISHGGR